MWKKITALVVAIIIAFVMLIGMLQWFTIRQYEDQMSRIRMQEVETETEVNGWMSN